MKKLLFAIVSIGIATGAHAQVNSIGPTVGLNYAWLSDNSNNEARPSFNIGVLFIHSILESSGIGIEARYSQEGFRSKIGNQSFTHQLNYLRIPLEFNYYFGDLEDDFRPKIFAGPSLGFLVGGKSKTLVGENIVTVDSKDLYEAFDFGVNAGVGFNYRLDDLIWLNFDAAYTHGFLKVTQGNTASEPQNRLINLNLGVAFGF